MTPRWQQLATDWKAWTGVILALGGLSESVTGLFSKFLALQTAFQSLPLPTQWTFAFILFLMAILIFGASLRRRSVLLKPERFLLSADDPEHLVGREEHITALAEECRRFPLVQLIGESGSGKSALVKAGLMPRLRAPSQQGYGLSRPVPLLLDASALRWENGIRDALMGALLSAFRAAEYMAPAALTALDKADPFDWLENALQPSGPEMLIIFDQMDDYFLAHHSHFMNGSKVVSPSELTAANPDWAALARLLETHRLHLLLVCRADAAAMLHALQFTQAPGPYLLPRVDERLLAPVLDTITIPRDTETVVANPEKGWVQLKTRLLRDLNAGGQILPVQLAVVLNGLRRLPFLSPRVYERHGGSRGLERLHIERYLQDATRGLGVNEAALLRGLLTLTNEDRTKTRRVSRHDFYQTVLENNTPEAALNIAVENLVRWRILRRQVDGDEEFLLLYHDYLARGLYEMYRHANQFTELLRQHTQEFTEAVGLFQKWWALLSPATQLRLLWARLRRRFRYGSYRTFALWSGLRLLPLCLTLVAFIAAGIWWQRTLEARSVENMIAVIRDQRKLSRVEEDTWWQMATLTDRTRLYAAQAMFASPGHFPKLKVHTERFAHVVVGLDIDGRLSRQVFKRIIAPIIRDAPSTSPFIAISADFSTYLHWTTDTASMGVAILIARMQTESDSRTLSSLGRALWSLSSKLDTDDVRPGAAALIKRMQTELERWKLSPFEEALGILSSKLHIDDMESHAAALIERMQTKSDHWTLSSLGWALWILSSKLDADDVRPGAAALIKRMQTESDSGTLLSLGWALWILSSKLDADDVRPGAAALIKRMQTESDSRTLSALGWVLRSLSSKLDADDVESHAAALIKRMQTESDRGTLSALGAALGGLSSKLDADDVRPGAAALIKRMQTESDSGTLSALGWALGSLSSKLDADDVRPVAAVLRRLLIQTNRDLVDAWLALETAANRDRRASERFTDYVTVLQSPFVLGDRRRKILGGLEKMTGEEFNGNLWDFVRWATASETVKAWGVHLTSGRPAK